jgi:hypothetical protein
MIETGLPLFAPEDQLELPAVMLHVTALASLVDDPGVVAPSCCDPLFEQPMAVETELRRHPLLLAVTLEASIAPLQARVRGAQRARRDLSLRSTGAMAGQQDPQPGHENHRASRVPHPGDHP